MNNKKQELINKVAENMEKHGVAEEHSQGTCMDLEPFVESLRWLPIENLERLAELDLSKCKSFAEAYQYFGKEGILRFKPYVVDSRFTNNPTMCIRINRFIHLFRGYHFQASGTVHGIGDYNSGSYRLDFLTRGFTRVVREGLLYYMLWWAALIDVGFNYDNFRELFNNDVSVIEQFLAACRDRCYVYSKYNWSDVEKYIEFSDGNINTMERKMYHLYDEGKVFGYLAIGRKTVQVELANNLLLTITIPDLNEGNLYDLNNEDSRDEFDEQIEILEKNFYLEMIAVMALALSGVKISFVNWYPYSKKLTPMRAINAPGVVNVLSLNDIYKCEPDEF